MYVLVRRGANLSWIALFCRIWSSIVYIFEFTEEKVVEGVFLFGFVVFFVLCFFSLFWFFCYFFFKKKPSILEGRELGLALVIQ